jgi:hypothetical protein
MPDACVASIGEEQHTKLHSAPNAICSPAEALARGVQSVLVDVYVRTNVVHQLAASSLRPVAVPAAALRLHAHAVCLRSQTAGVMQQCAGGGCKPGHAMQLASQACRTRCPHRTLPLRHLHGRSLSPCPAASCSHSLPVRRTLFSGCLGVAAPHTTDTDAHRAWRWREVALSATSSSSRITEGICRLHRRWCCRIRRASTSGI